MKLYNPSEQTRYAMFPERCILGKAPTLASVARDYGQGVVESWLVIELNDYNNFVGGKEEGKLELNMLIELARMIAARYYYLKLSELMLFFQKLKYGEFGKHYGYIDAVQILAAIPSFLLYRSRVIGEANQKEDEKRREEAKKNAVSLEQYFEIQKAKGKESQIKRLLSDLNQPHPTNTYKEQNNGFKT